MVPKVKGVVVTIQSIQILSIGNYFFNEINKDIISDKKIINL